MSPAEKSAWGHAAMLIGRTAAQGAAIRAADAFTTVEEIERTLDLLEADDEDAYQAALARLPAPPTLTDPRGLARWITEQDDPSEEVVEEIASAYAAGVAEQFEAACVRTLRRWLP